MVENLKYLNVLREFKVNAKIQIKLQLSTKFYRQDFGFGILF
jgi:hypothetical protein